MHWSEPEVDYREFRLCKLKEPRFAHLYLLLYWPIYGLLFLFVERFYQVKSYTPMHCFLDDLVPFNELFLIPYLFWFVYLVGMLVYTLFQDVDCFRRLMRFLILTYSVAIIAYLLFPTCQNLRPTDFPRENFLVDFIRHFYAFDTNTNVCPSIHVLGSLAVMFASWHCKGITGKGWKAAFTVCGLLISISTVFMKQHSCLDVLAAIPISLFAYWYCFCRAEGTWKRKHKDPVGESGV